MTTSHNCRVRVRAITLAPTSPDPIIAEALEHFGGRRRFRPGTLRTYRTVLREMSAILAGRSLLEATRQDITAWHASQDAKGNSAGTVIRKQGALSTFYGWLLETERIPKSPTVGMVRPKTPKRLPKNLSDAQVERLLATLRDDTPEDRLQAAVVLCLYYTGMRAAEALGLNVEDWDRVTGHVRVVGKGDKERALYVPPKLAAVLDATLADHGHPASGPMFRFPYGRGRRLTYQPMRLRVHAAFRAAGIKGASPHSLRHTHATKLVRNGVPLAEIQILLGHVNIQTTLGYANVDISASTREAIARLL